MDNDKSSMWINPSSTTFENTLPPAATITKNLTGTGINDIDVVNRFYIRSGCCIEYSIDRY